MPAVADRRALLTTAVAAGLTPLLKGRGFRKERFIWQRRLGETTQLIEIQLSRAFRTDGVFFVNVGVTVDALRALGVDRTGQVVVGGEAVDFGTRLTTLAPTAPSAVAVDADANQLGEELHVALTPVLETLDRVDGPDGLLREFTHDRGFQKIVRAQLRYVTGDRAGALEDLRAVATQFADRRGCTLPELLERSGLGALAATT